VLFGWGCRVLAYGYSNSWWLLVSVIPYVTYQAFNNKDRQDDA